MYVTIHRETNGDSEQGNGSPAVPFIKRPER